LKLRNLLPIATLGAMILGSAPNLAAAHHHDHHDRITHQAAAVVITVSCFRGPFGDVIWDRPEPVFIDSLVNAGYTYPEAHAIGERVCRDASAVGIPGALRASMTTIYTENPPAR